MNIEPNTIALDSDFYDLTVYEKQYFAEGRDYLGEETLDEFIARKMMADAEAKAVEIIKTLSTAVAPPTMPACFLQDVKKPAEFTTVTVDSVLADIKNGKYRSQIEGLPNPQTDAGKYRAAKLTLPAIAFNGTFEGRITNDRFAESNGLCIVDIDHRTDIEADRAAIIANIPSTYAVWLSPSRNGLKVLIRIPDDLIHNDAEHKSLFVQITDMFSAIGIDIDQSGKDVRRVCFVSYDENIYINRDAVCMAVMPLEIKPNAAQIQQQPKPALVDPSVQDTLIQRCLALMEAGRGASYHVARFNAGRLAGGFIAGNQIDEKAAVDALIECSNAISDEYTDDDLTRQRELKALMDGLADGKLEPIHGIDELFEKGEPLSEEEKARYRELAAEDAQAGEPKDYNIAPPKPTEGMLYGFAGEVGRIAAEDTEVNPYAACMDVLLMLSAEFGRDVYYPIGNTYHHPRLFGLHVGRSGRGRKGDALALAKRIREKVSELHDNSDLDEVESQTLGQMHTGGLSSREGLTVFIHDGYKQGKGVAPAIKDKRLFIVESEFANILHQSKREGNTLSAALRDVWDGQSLKPATKNNQLFATDPHIALLGNITPKELVDLMQSNDLTNGFANRFLIFFAERTKLVPFPSPTSDDTVSALAHRMYDIIQFAKGDYPNTQNNRKAALSPDAAEMYKSIYPDLNATVGANIDPIIERRAPYTLRLALCFALTDKSLIIETHHLEAAYQWVKYWEASVRFIFQSGMQEAETKASNETADKILAFLEEHGPASRTDISTLLFKRNKTSGEIDSALRFLLAESPSKIELIEPVKKGNGRQAKVYSLVAKAAR